MTSLEHVENSLLTSLEYGKEYNVEGTKTRIIKPKNRFTKQHQKISNNSFKETLLHMHKVVTNEGMLMFMAS